jgi:phosphatidylglycerophosphate synthase
MGVVAFFSVANLLSLARVPLGALFVVVWGASWGGEFLAIAVLAAAALTDVLDGMFARRVAAARLVPGLAPAAVGSPQVHPHPAGTGSWLDPICDKIFVATVLVAIWSHLHPPPSLLALILAREIAQAPLSLVYLAVPALRHWLHYDFRASLLGKAATVSQFAAITAIVLELAASRGLAWLSFGLGMLALGDYLLRALRLGFARSRTPG